MQMSAFGGYILSGTKICSSSFQLNHLQQLIRTLELFYFILFLRKINNSLTGGF